MPRVITVLWRVKHEGYLKLWGNKCKTKVYPLLTYLRSTIERLDKGQWVKKGSTSSAGPLRDNTWLKIQSVIPNDVIFPYKLGHYRKTFGRGK